MQQPEPQLEMIHYGDTLPTVPAVSDGYSLRQYEEADRASYWGLFARVFETRSRLDDLRTASLPGGFFVVTHESSGDVVASAVAAEYERPGHPTPGSLQWVMASPGHIHKGLGLAVVAAATERLSVLGCGRVHLSTDDWRLPAINLYLKLGWKPLLFEPAMKPRWLRVFEGLGRRPVEGELVVEHR